MVLCLPKPLIGRKSHAEEDFLQKLESLNLDPRLKKLLITYEEVFGALPPPLSCKKLVQMDLKLKPEFEKTRVRCRPYPAPQEQVEEIERQIQECIDAGLVEEYKQGGLPPSLQSLFPGCQTRVDCPTTGCRLW